MLRSLLTTVFAAITIVGCSDDQGVKARISQNTHAAPEEVIQQALTSLGKVSTNQVTMNSVSSQAIRKDTMGIRITMSGTDTITVKVEHFESMDGNRCRSTNQTLQIPSAKLMDMNKGNGITLSCVDSKCTYAMLIIDRSHSSMLDSSGFVPAFVPVLLGVRGFNEGGQRYYIPSQGRDPFLTLPGNVQTICTKPDVLVNYEHPVVISPVDNTGPIYNYFPDDDNNTWIYY